LQRQQALGRRRRRAREFVAERFDLVDDAAVRGRRGSGTITRQCGRPKAGGVEVAVHDLDVDVVPFPRRTVAGATGAAVRIPKPVRPGRLAGKRGIRGKMTRIGREQRSDFQMHGCRQEMLGDQTDDFVAFVPPGLGSGRQQQTNQ